MWELSGYRKSVREVEVYLEQAKETIEEEGYEADEDEQEEEGMSPKEDEDPDDSEDEKQEEEVGDETEEVDGDDEVEAALTIIPNEAEVDDGDDVIIDAGNGGDDSRFLTVFEEILERDPYLENEVRELLKMLEQEEKDANVETDPKFGLGDEMYPDTPLESEEEWKQWKNPRKEKRNMKGQGDMDKDPYLWLFQIFNSGLEFKDQLLKYSLNTQFDVKMAKSEVNRIAAVCKNKECPWRVFCSVEKRLNKWMVKVFHYKYNHGSSSRVSMLKQGVIACLFREEIRRNIKFPANDINDIIKESYDIVVILSKCYKGRRIALDSVLEAQTIQFRKLGYYEAELKRSNKGISTEILTLDEENGKKQFKGFYICFKEIRETWHKWCRSVIGLDGCFLKWDIEGDLLSAVGRDADNKMYPIAWAVVTGETKETWVWFQQKLKVDLELGVGNNLTIISDKQKFLQKSHKSGRPLKIKPA